METRKTDEGLSLRVLFVSDGRMGQEMDRCACANADAVADCFDEERAETQGEAIYWSVYIHRPSPIVMSAGY